MTAHAFLSPEWIEAALRLRDEYADRLPPPVTPVRMNLVITEVPHGDDDRLAASIDTAESGLLPRFGHLANPELTVTMEYEAARAVLVDQDPDAIGRAFLSGRMRVEGDVTRLFLLQSLEPSGPDLDLAREVSARLREMTA